MKTFVITLLLFTSTIILAQDVIGTAKTHIIQSSVFEKERKIRVILPNDYEENTTTAYNVIYVLDGSWDARVDYIAGSIQFLYDYGDFPASIIVGIHSDDRTFEFTPVPKNPKTREYWGERNIGGVPKLQEFLKKEVFPLLEEEYRITSFKGIVGHSLGGTFCIADLSGDDPLFNAYITTSPNLDFDDEQILSDLEGKLNILKPFNKLLYISVGTEGRMENLFTPGVNKIEGLFNFKNPEGLRFKKKSNPGLHHGTTPLVGTLEGLLYLGEQWSLDDTFKTRLINGKGAIVEKLQAHYKSLSQWLDYLYSPSASEINNTGYYVLYEGEATEAVKVFDWGITLHPEDANLYDSRGEALEKSGNVSAALASYQKALSVLENFKSNYDEETYSYNKEVYLKNIARTQKLK